MVSGEAVRASKEVGYLRELGEPSMELGGPQRELGGKKATGFSRNDATLYDGRMVGQMVGSSFGW